VEVGKHLGSQVDFRRGTVDLDTSTSLNEAGASVTEPSREIGQRNRRGKADNGMEVSRGGVGLGVFFIEGGPNWVRRAYRG